MSVTLPARAAALRARLARLHEMESNVAEASELEKLRSDLSRKVGKLSEPLEKERLLRSSGISVPIPQSLVAARKRASTLVERFVAAPKSATLKRAQTWPTLLGEIESASRELNAAVLAAWKAHRSKAFGGDTPGAIETKLAKTKDNTKALGVYQGLYNQLRALFDEPPADRTTIARAAKLGAELEAAAKAFDFNVKPEVKAFLEAVQSVGGAPLSLLSREVLDWLRENNIVDAYRVKSTDRA